MADTRLPAMPPLADGASEVLPATSAALSAPALHTTDHTKHKSVKASSLMLF